jgi:peptidoglycan-N-acetylglucosamine deacetylase
MASKTYRRYRFKRQSIRACRFSVVSAGVTSHKNGYRVEKFRWYHRFRIRLYSGVKEQQMNRQGLCRIWMKLFRIAFMALLTTGFICPCTTTTALASEKTVYLTFDDGPDPRYTPLILDILQKEHVKATFFVLGFRSKQYPFLARRIHNEGHEIGNHGYYHTFIVHKSKDWLKSDITRADATIRAACGVQPKFFRPPGGILSRQDAELVSQAGHPVAMWTVDTNDWKSTNSASILQAIKNQTRPNAIILMHDGTPSSKNTVNALPSVIHYLRSAGYTFATLPEEYHGTYLGRPTDSTNHRFKKGNAYR